MGVIKKKIPFPYSKSIINNSAFTYRLDPLKAKNEYAQHINAFQILFCEMFSNFNELIVLLFYF